MKILITGAAGQLGQEWHSFLLDREIPFKACTSNELDITNPDSISAEFARYAPDWIINCAAYTNVDGAETDIELAFKVNQTGVSNLVKECLKTNSKLVHFSTDYIFPGDISDTFTYPNGYPEDAPAQPINVYGKSKRAGEIIIEQSDLHALMIRVSWLCGVYGQNFVKTMLRLGKERDELQIVNDQTGSPTFTRDLVEKTFQLMQLQESGTFHISSYGSISWFDFAKEIFKSAKMDVKLKPVDSSTFKTKAKRPYFSLLNKEKIMSKGIEPEPWKIGLHNLLHQLNNES